MIVPNPKRITCTELIKLADKAKGQIDHIYLHWTAGRYYHAYDDYHLNIDQYGHIYQTCEDFTDKKAHTWKRNTGAIGIAIDGCYDACAGIDPQNIYFGNNPPTREQLFVLAWVIAFLCVTLDIEIKPPYVMTHEEAATLDGYGPNGPDPDLRWDLWYLPDYMSKENCCRRIQEVLNDTNRILHHGGDLLRQMASKYSQNLKIEDGECVDDNNVPLLLCA